MASWYPFHEPLAVSQLQYRLSLASMNSRALTPFYQAFSREQVLHALKQVLHALMHHFTSNKLHASTSITLQACLRIFVCSSRHSRSNFAHVLSVSQSVTRAVQIMARLSLQSRKIQSIVLRYLRNCHCISTTCWRGPKIIESNIIWRTLLGAYSLVRLH